MTPIYGRPFCNNPCHDPVTGRDKKTPSNLKVSRPLTLDVTVFGDFLSVNHPLSRLSRRNGYLTTNREM
jgi:hypothetical protein